MVVKQMSDSWDSSHLYLGKIELAIKGLKGEIFLCVNVFL